ncbi:helix-turn-helix domain-containing protein [Microvirga antarctica]|uniref:helix-turn-helix domain-containing protein n=1 Tax=Microvirga antarctica TaxID=2819233 RepID=UPI001B30CD5E
MTLLLKLPVAARELAVGMTTLNSLVREGRLPIRKIGRSTRVHRTDLENFAERLPVGNVLRESTK